MKKIKHSLCTLSDFTQFTTAQLMDLLKQMKKIADKQGVSMIMADNTLITTYGLKYNEYSSFFDNVVVLDDLFL